MVKLMCAIVGEAGSAFEVDVGDDKTVGDLKKAVKDQSDGKITVPWLDLKLFAKERGAGQEEKGEGEKVLGDETEEKSREVGGFGAVDEEKSGDEQEWLTELDVLDGVKVTRAYNQLQFVSEELRDVGLSSDDLVKVNKKEKAAGKGPVHVLVEVPEPRTVLGKRTRVIELFPNKRIKAEREVMEASEEKVDTEVRETNKRVFWYFKMNNFPPMAHTVSEYAAIMERDAYATIFRELIKTTKETFEAKNNINVVVTGNPGTGKSRFYLHVIFHLIVQPDEQVRKLPDFKLVTNFGDTYEIYDAKDKSFAELPDQTVKDLQREKNVLRLVEGYSSRLLGWQGVSILFASPGAPDIKDFLKDRSRRYIMPVWSLDELADCNSLLEERLKLADDDLLARYENFGGIPRFIFPADKETTISAVEQGLDSAIATFSAIELISYAKGKSPVREENYSHRILQMVPTENNFLEKYYLDFLSSSIADKVMARLDEESLHKLSAFAIAQYNDSGITSVMTGKVYEMFCHKWFDLPQQQQQQQQQKTLNFRPLGPGKEFKLEIPENMRTERFQDYNKIKKVPVGWTYYRPNSGNFGALDAFIVHKTGSACSGSCNRSVCNGSVCNGSACYGLQMTLNREHGIAGAPLNKFLKWLEKEKICKFSFGFVVPSKIETEYHLQSVKTKTGKDSERPGASKDVEQFVAALDAIFPE